MSFYVDFNLACIFEQDTPQHVIDTLTYMTRNEDYPFDHPPDHPYFDEENWWRSFLQEDSPHRFMAGDFCSTFRKHQIEADCWHTLNVRRCMHDDEYRNTVWWEFLDWLAKESSTESYIGYFRSGLEWEPTLILFQNKTVYMMNAVGTPVPLFEQSPEWDEEKIR